MNTELRLAIIKEFGTQADFAQHLGEHESQVSQIVRGRRKLPPERKKIWAKLLKCKPEELFKV